MENKKLKEAIEEQYLKMYSINEVNMVRDSDIGDLANAIEESLVENRVEVKLAKYDQIEAESKLYSKNEKEQLAFRSGAIWIKSELLKNPKQNR